MFDKNVLMMGISVILLAIGVWSMIRSSMEGRDDDLSRQAKKGARTEREIRRRTNIPDRADGSNRRVTAILRGLLAVMAVLTVIVSLAGIIREVTEESWEDEEVEEDFDIDPEDPMNYFASGETEDGYYYEYYIETYSSYEFWTQPIEEMCESVYGGEYNTYEEMVAEDIREDGNIRLTFYNYKGALQGYMLLTYEGNAIPSYVGVADSEGTLEDVWLIQRDDTGLCRWEGVTEEDGYLHIEYTDADEPVFFTIIDDQEG